VDIQALAQWRRLLGFTVKPFTTNLLGVSPRYACCHFSIVYNTSMAIQTIILDTNVLVAALRSRSGASFKLLSLLPQQRFKLALTVPLLFEYEDVLSREALGIDASSANDVLDYVCLIASKHEVHFMWRPLLRDAKDDMVLEAAVSAQASTIVTFNTKDFKGSERFGVQAQWPGDFLKQLGVQP
jgi:putative PIN family toxin of toxin-antitoxin system